VQRPGLWIMTGLLLAVAGAILGMSTPWLSAHPDWVQARKIFQTLAFTALLAVLLGLVLAGIAFAVYRKREALRAGTGLLARWRVGMTDWAAFRRRDAARGTLFHSLRNRLRLPPELPPEGMEIRVGTDALLIGDACYGLGYFASRGKLVDVALVEGEPAMIEFVTHQQGKNHSRLALFRVPVPGSARAEAQTLLAHFAGAIDPKRRDFARTRFAPHFQAATGDAGEAEAARAEDSSRNWRGIGLGLLLTGLVMLGVSAWIGSPPNGRLSGLRLFTIAGGLVAAAGVIALLVSALRRRS